MRVTHGYLPGEDGAGPIFVSHHAPAGAARDIAYVLCLPLHLDLIQSHRSMRRCAEVLADAGFHVLRLHYEGTTESIGSTDFDEGRVAKWLASVRRGVAAMAKVVERVGLIGVRIGGAFALEASTHVEVAQLILWETSAGNMYGREMEILASSAPQPDPPIGEGVVAGGYWLSKATLADLARLELEKLTPRGKPDVLLVQRDDRKPLPRLQQHLERAGCAVTMVQPPGHKEMMVMPQRSAVPTKILETIRDWAVANSRPVETTSAPALSNDVAVDGLRWKTLRFGSAGHLFGVRTEPATGPSGKPGVLLLTGGVTPRTAGNNSYVTLAERLAKRGHTVVRMDVAFIGESGTADGQPGQDTEPYPPSLLEDARAGLEQLSTSTAWVYGLCSGALAAFDTARADPRVVGAVIVNPERFDLPTAEAAPAISTVDQVEQINHWLRVIKDPATWKRIVTGDIAFGHAMRVIGARVRSRTASLEERVAVKLGREPKGFAGDVARMLARGAKVHFVFSAGDPGYEAVTSELGARRAELERKGLGMTTFERADHNFHEMSSRAKMLDWTVDTISGSSR